MKKKLRQQVRHHLMGMPAPVRQDKSRKACLAMMALKEFEAARSVMLYLPMVEEVDTLALAQKAWQMHKHVLAPRVDMAQRTMQAYEIFSLGEGLVPGPYDILEPRDGPVWAPGQIDFIVVPALAFDRRGGRLGRGAGFYDRFLSQATGGVFCGLAYAEQIMDELPMFDHDQRVDIVVTDQEVLDFR